MFACSSGVLGGTLFFLKPQSGRPLLCCGRQSLVDLCAGHSMTTFLEQEEQLSSLIPLYLSNMLW